MSQNQDNSKQLPHQQNPSPGQQVQSEPKTPPVQPDTQQSEPKNLKKIMSKINNHAPYLMMQ